MNSIFTEEFLSKYRATRPNWGFGDVGYTVYRRTYSRIKDDGTQEDWVDTIKRCIDGAVFIGAKYTKDEAERLFDYIFNFKCSFSGRGTWQLGTKLVNDFKIMDSTLNCLRGDTLVLTRIGWKKIKELKGKTAEIVTKNGKWVRAPILSFGKQKLYKLTFKEAYNKSNIEIFATAGHEWIVGTKRIKTIELKSGQKVPIVLGRNGGEYLSPQGIQHGLVYGDGSCNGIESFIDLIDNTYDFCKKYFNLNRISWENKNNPRHVRFGGMPNYYKELPNIEENRSYLMGFLAGWIAADGHVKKCGSIRLFNKDKKILEFARDIASVCGLRTSPPYLERDINPFNGESANLYSISFNLYDNPEILVIKDDHISNLEKKSGSKRNCDYARVISIEETNLVEEVFCAEVEGTHSFVIDGNILTGNCWITKVSSIDDFCFIFTESMFGGGVGCNISKEYTQELPRVKTGVNVELKNTKDADFIVPDSKEGWCSLWRKTLEAHLVTGKSFSYSTVCIRTSGEPIKTFGGIAPGPKPLVDGVTEINKILSSRAGKKLRTQDVADIVCCGGQLVKSGGVRRTALILLGDVDDASYLNLKRWDLGNIPNYRANSNNSIICNNFDHLPDKFWDGYNGNGEPYGLVNLKNAKRYGRTGETDTEGLILKDDDIIGFNPCAEATLHDKESCNLAELFINNINSKEEMLDCAKLLYKTQKAIAAGNYYHEDTNKVVHKNMRLGLGITGICQRLDVLDDWCEYVYRELRKFDKKYSEENGFPQSIRLTVVKPSGTLSLLGGSTPGGHPGFARYFIRRIRFSANDPIINDLRKMNYDIEPEIGFDNSLNHDILVAGFPCRFSDSTVISKDVSAINQLELVKRLQRIWADQAVSVTVYYKREELDDIKKWLKENYNSSIKSVSFLLHSDHGFKQAPMQEIDAETYQKMISKIRKLEKLSNHDFDGEIDSQECAGGHCPIK